MAGHLAIRGDPTKTRILDPCRGEGAALASLGELLGVRRRTCTRSSSTCSRAQDHRRLPGREPARPLCVQARRRSRGTRSWLIYLNPPFDDEYGGGGREKAAFVRRAINLLRAGRRPGPGLPRQPGPRQPQDVLAARHLVRAGGGLRLPGRVRATSARSPCSASAASGSSRSQETPRDRGHAHAGQVSRGARGRPDPRFRSSARTTTGPRLLWRVIRRIGAGRRQVDLHPARPRARGGSRSWP